MSLVLSHRYAFLKAKCLKQSISVHWEQCGHPKKGFFRRNKGLTSALPSSLQGSPSLCSALLPYLLLGLSCPSSGCLASAHLSLANPGQTSGMQIMFPVHPNHVSKNLFVLFLVALEDSYFKEQPCCLVFQFISLPLCLPSQPALPETESRLLAVLTGSHLHPLCWQRC